MLYPQLNMSLNMDLNLILHTEYSFQVFDETRDNSHWRKVQGGQVQILWQDGEQAFCNYVSF